MSTSMSERGLARLGWGLVGAVLLCALPVRAERVFSERELVPYANREPFKSASRQWGQGAYAETIRLLDPVVAATNAPPERYLRASALANLGVSEQAQAGVAFETLIEDLPALADRCAFSSGEAFQNAGLPDRAVASYLRVPRGSLFWNDAQAALATIYQRQGRLDDAAAILRGLPQDSPSLAMLDEARGETKSAANRYLNLWAAEPKALLADDYLARAKALGATPSTSLQIARANRLADANASREAAKILEPIVRNGTASSGTDRCLAEYALGKSYRKMRRHTEALQVFGTMLDHCPKDEVRVKSLYLAGFSGSVVDPEAGIRYYDELAREFPNHSFADDAIYNAAELELRLGRTEDAEKELSRLISLYPEGDYRADALFKLAWLARERQDFTAAQGYLTQTISDYAQSESPEWAQRARYWLGRVQEQAGRGSDAIATWERLVTEAPVGYYALLARERIAEVDTVRAHAIAPPLPVSNPAGASYDWPLGPLARDRHYGAALELYRLGFSSDAKAELRAVDRSPLVAGEERDGMRALVMATARLGEPRVALALANRYLRRELIAPSGGSSMALFRTVYPLAYRSSLERHTNAVGIDTDLLQALMREESALDPGIKSWAGAVGLCQLMPATARMVARQLKIKGNVTEARLTDPDFNIRLGATYLSQLLGRYQGNAALALAGYNAGPGSVNRWVGANPGRKVDELVEQIPIYETRNYVKRVLKSYAAYRLGYGRTGDLVRIDQGLAELERGDTASSEPRDL